MYYSFTFTLDNTLRFDFNPLFILTHSSSSLSTWEDASKPCPCLRVINLLMMVSQPSVFCVFMCVKDGRVLQYFCQCMAETNVTIRFMKGWKQKDKLRCLIFTTLY